MTLLNEKKKGYEGPKTEEDCGEHHVGNMCLFGPFRCGKAPCTTVIEWPVGGKFAQPEFVRIKARKGH